MGQIVGANWSNLCDISQLVGRIAQEMLKSVSNPCFG
jgi:hypothetical protein